MGMYFIISMVRRPYEKSGFKTCIDASSFQQTGMIYLFCAYDGEEDTVFCFYKTLTGEVYESHKGLQSGCFWSEEREVSAYV